MKKFLWVLFFIALTVVLAGIYKFNFTDDDIYMKNSKDEFVKHDELDKR